MKVKNKISDIISLNSIPQELAFFEKNFSKLLNSIYFYEYNIGYSNNNATVAHSLHIVTDEIVGLTIPDTNLKFLLNYEGDNSAFSPVWCSATNQP